MIQKQGKFNFINAIFGVVFLVFALIALFWLAKGIFTILAWLAPILLIATLIIDYQTILGYGKWILHQLKTNTLVGVAVSLLTVIGFPLVSFFLFGKALLKRKIKSLETAYRADVDDNFTEYEIVDEDPVERLELPPLQKRKESAADEYERLFD
ncbi:MAG: hypothetical protein HKN76_08435 [Saprospiraceae bacterium]|nr:hypothetical protein [Saprospiraceae bacterium]